MLNIGKLILLYFKEQVVWYQNPATLQQVLQIHPPFIIKEKDNSLTYIQDNVAEDLMNNLIKFMDEHPATEIIFEEDKSEENTQIHQKSPSQMKT